MGTVVAADGPRPLRRQPLPDIVPGGHHKPRRALDQRPHCVLFLWATGPMNPHALVVMAAWGFDYVSQHAWGKDKFGTGYWNREKHELLLIGTRGNVPCPAPGTQWELLIMAPRGRHSEKPNCVLEMIEQYFPNVPKIELNRRGPPRQGWDAWGNEAELRDEAAK